MLEGRCCHGCRCIGEPYTGVKCSKQEKRRVRLQDATKKRDALELTMYMYIYRYIVYKIIQVQFAGVSNDPRSQRCYVHYRNASAPRNSSIIFLFSSLSLSLYFLSHTRSPRDILELSKPKLPRSRSKIHFIFFLDHWNVSICCLATVRIRGAGKREKNLDRAAVENAAASTFPVRRELQWLYRLRRGPKHAVPGSCGG